MNEIDIPLPKTPFQPTVEDVRDSIMDAAYEEARIYSPTWGEMPLMICNARRLDAHTVQFQATSKMRKFVLTVVEI